MEKIAHTFSLEGEAQSRFPAATFLWSPSHSSSQRSQPSSRRLKRWNKGDEVQAAPVSARRASQQRSLSPENFPFRLKLHNRRKARDGWITCSSHYQKSCHLQGGIFFLYFPSVNRFLSSYSTKWLENKENKYEYDKYYPMHRHTNCHGLCSNSAGKYFRQQKTWNWTSSKRKCKNEPAYTSTRFEITLWNKSNNTGTIFILDYCKCMVKITWAVPCNALFLW